MNPVAPWMHDRPIRNNNPGDLRPRSEAPPWPGQDAIDHSEGGPFAIFVTPVDGWAALGLWCLDARYLRGLRTAEEMVAVFAPPSENDTKSYAAGIAVKMGSGALDLQNQAVLSSLCRAIAHWEESHPIWTDVEVTSGISLCALRWPTYRADRTAPSSHQMPRPTEQPSPPSVPTAGQPAAAESTDQLNQAELGRIEGNDA